MGTDILTDPPANRNFFKRPATNYTAQQSRNQKNLTTKTRSHEDWHGQKRGGSLCSSCLSWNEPRSHRIFTVSRDLGGIFIGSGASPRHEELRQEGSHFQHRASHPLSSIFDPRYYPGI